MGQGHAQRWGLQVAVDEYSVGQGPGRRGPGGHRAGPVGCVSTNHYGLCPTLLLLLLAGVFEDLEDLTDERLTLLGREVPGVDGLLVGLEVPRLRLFSQVTVYEAHDSVDLLARETVAAPG